MLIALEVFLSNLSDAKLPYILEELDKSAVY